MPEQYTQKTTPVHYTVPVSPTLGFWFLHDVCFACMSISRLCTFRRFSEKENHTDTMNTS